MLTIHLLGTPELRRDGAALQIARRKSRALLFYIAAQPDAVSRAQLMALFWPDHERSAAQQLLRTTLHGLRRQLPEALLVGDSSLELDQQVGVDVRALELALRHPGEATLARALAGVRGDFLDGFTLPDSPEFDEWINAERERFRRLVLRGWELLARRRVERGALEEGLDALAHALTLDPLHEQIQREAMTLEYRLGNRAGAIRRFEQLRQELDDQLGVPPMPETSALYDAIVTDALPEPAPSAAPGLVPAPQPAQLHGPAGDSLPFVGRERELAILQGLLGRPRLALIEGEPGIGKTGLVEELIRRSGALALRGTARELEQAIPYQPISEALRSLLADPGWPALLARLAILPIWLAELTRLVPEFGAAGAASTTHALDESRLWEAVSQLLLALARERPTIVFLDDIQWADSATHGLVAYLARRTAGEPLALIAATRPPAPRTSVAMLIQTLTREDRIERLALARLDGDAIDALARAVSPVFPEPLADWLMRNGEGSPYITVELVRYAREQQLLGLDGRLAPALAGGPLVPHSVHSLIQSRLARLSEPGRRLLDTAVAVGREFEFDLVARASGLPEAAVLDAIDELRASGLILARGGQRYSFDHSLTLEVAYREIDEARHRSLHRRVAQAIEWRASGQLDDVAGLLAWHLAEAGDQREAAAYALRAARHAAGLAAWQEAIAFFKQALAGSTNGAEITVLMELGKAYVHVGEAVLASETFERVAAQARKQGDRVTLDAALLATSETLMQQARYAEAIAIVRDVRERGHPGSAMRAELQWGVTLSVEGADLAGASQHLQLAEQRVDPASDPATLSHIVFELGSVRAQQGQLDAAIGLYERALELAERDSLAIRQRILTRNNLAYHKLLRGDADAEQYARAGLQLAQDSGVLPLQSYLHSTLGEIALARGDLAAAEREFIEGLALAERLNIPERVAGLTANLGLVAARHGQNTLAVHRLSAAQVRADTLGIPHLAAQIRIWLAPLLPPAEAHATLAAARAIAEAGHRQLLLDEIERLEMPQ